ncbi:MAG: DEAD/DEAH box helicase family protein [Candidatus Aenigmatarchaeota archaeon]
MRENNLYSNLPDYNTLKINKNDLEIGLEIAKRLGKEKLFLSLIEKGYPVDKLSKKLYDKYKEYQLTKLSPSPIPKIEPEKETTLDTTLKPTPLPQPQKDILSDNILIQPKSKPREEILRPITKKEEVLAGFNRKGILGEIKDFLGGFLTAVPTATHILGNLMDFFDYATKMGFKIIKYKDLPDLSQNIALENWENKIRDIFQTASEFYKSKSEKIQEKYPSTTITEFDWKRPRTYSQIIGTFIPFVAITALHPQAGATTIFADTIGSIHKEMEDYEKHSGIKIPEAVKDIIAPLTACGTAYFLSKGVGNVAGANNPSIPFKWLARVFRNPEYLTNLSREEFQKNANRAMMLSLLENYVRHTANTGINFELANIFDNLARYEYQKDSSFIKDVIVKSAKQTPEALTQSAVLSLLSIPHIAKELAGEYKIKIEKRPKLEAETPKEQTEIRPEEKPPEPPEPPPEPPSVKPKEPKPKTPLSPASERLEIPKKIKEDYGIEQKEFSIPVETQQKFENSLKKIEEYLKEQKQKIEEIEEQKEDIKEEAKETPQETKIKDISIPPEDISKIPAEKIEIEPTEREETEKVLKEQEPKVIETKETIEKIEPEQKIDIEQPIKKAKKLLSEIKKEIKEKRETKPPEEIKIEEPIKETPKIETQKIEEIEEPKLIEKPTFIETKEDGKAKITEILEKNEIPPQEVKPQEELLIKEKPKLSTAPSQEPIIAEKEKITTEQPQEEHILVKAIKGEPLTDEATIQKPQYIEGLKGEEQNEENKMEQNELDGSVFKDTIRPIEEQLKVSDVYKETDLQGEYRPRETIEGDREYIYKGGRDDGGTGDVFGDTRYSVSDIIPPISEMAQQEMSTPMEAEPERVEGNIGTIEPLKPIDRLYKNKDRVLYLLTSKEKDRINNNEQCYKILKKSEQELTKEDLEILARFTGLENKFMKKFRENLISDVFNNNSLIYDLSILNSMTSFYTPPHIATRMALEVATALYNHPRLPKDGLVIGDLTAGSGIFYQAFPIEDFKDKIKEFVLNDIDFFAYNVMKRLYSKDSDVRILNKDIKDLDFPKNYFDVLLSNVPFNEKLVDDPLYNKYKLSLHNYCIAKMFDNLKVGGVMEVITSVYTLFATNDELRKFFVDRQLEEGVLPYLIGCPELISGHNFKASGTLARAICFRLIKLPTRATAKEAKDRHFILPDYMKEFKSDFLKLLYSIKIEYEKNDIDDYYVSKLSNKFPEYFNLRSSTGEIVFSNDYYDYLVSLVKSFKWGEEKDDISDAEKELFLKNAMSIVDYIRDNYYANTDKKYLLSKEYLDKPQKTDEERDFENKYRYINEYFGLYNEYNNQIKDRIEKSDIIRSIDTKIITKKDDEIELYDPLYIYNPVGSLITGIENGTEENVYMLTEHNVVSGIIVSAKYKKVNEVYGYKGELLYNIVKLNEIIKDIVEYQVLPDFDINVFNSKLQQARILYNRITDNGKNPLTLQIQKNEQFFYKVFYISKSLEKIEKIDGKDVYKPSDIFFKPIYNREIIHTDNVEEAISLSLFKNGKIELGEITKLTGKSTKEVIDEIVNNKIAGIDIKRNMADIISYEKLWKEKDEKAIKSIYELGDIVSKNVLLRGNILEKYDVLMSYAKDEEFMEKLPDDYKRLLLSTIDIIKEAVPSISDVSIQQLENMPLSSSIISKNLLEKLAQINNYWGFNLYLGALFRKYGLYNLIHSRDYDRAVKYIFDNIPMDFYTIDEYGKKIKDYKTKLAATTKLNLVRKEIIRELIKNFKDEIVEKYYKNYTVKLNYKNTIFDTIRVPYTTNQIKLRKHQIDALYQLIENDGGIVSLDVGYGKTYIGVFYAYGMLASGRAKRVLVICPNNITNNWYNHFKEVSSFYKIEILDPKDFSKSEAPKTILRLIHSDAKIFIVPQSVLDKTAKISVKCYKEFLDEASKENEIALMYNSSISRNEKKKFQSWWSNVKEELELMLLKVSRGNPDIGLDMINPDLLIVDEVHNYKGLPIISSLERAKNVKSSTSRRALYLEALSRYVKNRGGVFVGLTATPIVNALGDVYSMKKLSKPETMISKQGARLALDEWVKDFAVVVSKPVYNPKTMEIRVEDVLTIYNVENFVKELGECLILSPPYNISQELNLPQIKTGNLQSIYLPADEYQREIFDYIDKKQAKMNDPIYNHLNKLAYAINTAIDPRLLLGTNAYNKDEYIRNILNKIYDLGEDYLSPKVEELVNSVARNYHNTKDAKSVIAIFLDVGINKLIIPNKEYTLYDIIIKELIKRGISPEEIYDFSKLPKVKSEREKIYNKINNGQIRVVIGSTFKMGEGINIQNKLKYAYYLNVPYTPKALQQSMGRIIRQGNENKEVEIYFLGTQNSIEHYGMDILNRKINIIRAMLSGNAKLASEYTNIDLEELRKSWIFSINIDALKAYSSGNERAIRYFDTLPKEIGDIKIKILEKEGMRDSVSKEITRLSILQSDRLSELRRYSQILNNPEIAINEEIKNINGRIEDYIRTIEINEKTGAMEVVAEYKKKLEREKNRLEKYKDQTYIAKKIEDIKEECNRIIETARKDIEYCEDNIPKLFEEKHNINKELEELNKKLNELETEKEALKAELNIVSEEENVMDKIVEESNNEMLKIDSKDIDEDMLKVEDPDEGEPDPTLKDDMDDLDEKGFISMEVFCDLAGLPFKVNRKIFEGVLEAIRFTNKLYKKMFKNKGVALEESFFEKVERIISPMIYLAEKYESVRNVYSGLKEILQSNIFIEKDLLRNIKGIMGRTKKENLKIYKALLDLQYNTKKIKNEEEAKKQREIVYNNYNLNEEERSIADGFINLYREMYKYEMGVYNNFFAKRLSYFIPLNSKEFVDHIYEFTISILDKIEDEIKVSKRLIKEISNEIIEYGKEKGYYDVGSKEFDVIKNIVEKYVERIVRMRSNYVYNYVPLRRLGKYYVAVKGEKDVLFYATADTESEINFLVNRLKEKYKDELKMGAVIDTGLTERWVKEPFDTTLEKRSIWAEIESMVDLYSLIEDDEIYNKIKRAIIEKEISLQLESFMEKELKREKILGADVDLFKITINEVSRFLLFRRHILLSELLSDIKEEGLFKKNKREEKIIRDYIRYIVKEGSELEVVGKFAFFWLLWGNIKSAIVNSLTLFTHGYPYLKAYYDIKLEELFKSLKDLALENIKEGAGLSEDERKLINILKDFGIINPSFTNNLVSMNMSDNVLITLKTALKSLTQNTNEWRVYFDPSKDAFNDKWLEFNIMMKNKLEDLSLFSEAFYQIGAKPFALTEIACRVASMLAVYRKKFKGKEIDKNIIIELDRIQNRVAGDFSREGKPLIQRGKWLATATRLMSFLYHDLLFNLRFLEIALSDLPKEMRRRAQIALADKFFIICVLGGISATITGQLIAKAFEFLYKDDEEYYLVKKYKKWGRALYRGIPSLFGIDISGTLQPNIPIRDIENPEEISHLFLQLLTGIGGEQATKMVMDAVMYIDKKDKEGVLKSISPQAFKNILQAKEGYLGELRTPYTEEGKVKGIFNPKTRKFEPLQYDEYEAIMKALGFILNKDRDFTMESKHNIIKDELFKEEAERIFKSFFNEKYTMEERKNLIRDILAKYKPFEKDAIINKVRYMFKDYGRSKKSNFIDFPGGVKRYYVLQKIMEENK